MDDRRRDVPRTDAVLAEPRVAKAVGRLGRAAVKAIVVEVLQVCRDGGLAPVDVPAEVLARLPRSSTSLRATSPSSPG